VVDYLFDGLNMLKIKPIMNSTAEDVLAFKTCCSLRAWDQNLEIHVKNEGAVPVIVPSYFDLEGDGGVKRFDTLIPNGEQRIEPDKFVSFYCFMDEEVWKSARRIVFYDNRGNRYPFGLSQ
jgi:hypothetical protein